MAALDQLDEEGVEVIPQTLPPFPWYLGGQLFCNLFVDPADTFNFSQTYGRRLCLDIAHTKLACNHLHSSFFDAVEMLAPVSAHLHVVDASGIDGEGFQIDEGDVDFRVLAEQVDRLAPRAAFIPEISAGTPESRRGFLGRCSGPPREVSLRGPVDEPTVAPPREFDLSDQVILITGASGQIGSEVANVHVSYGASVVLSDVDEPHLMQERAKRLTDRHEGSTVLGLQLDVTSQDSVEAAFDSIERRFGRLDVLVNNAAIDGESSTRTRSTWSPRGLRNIPLGTSGTVG